MNAAVSAPRPIYPTPAAPVVVTPETDSLMLRLTRWQIWAYLILWIVEGSLRKWFLVGLSDVLLVIRDPVVLGIYATALVGRIFPFNFFVIALLILGTLSTMAGLVMLPDMPAIVLFGSRANFLHLPLIFIIGRALRPQDLKRMGLLLAVVALPQVLIMVKQYRSSIDDWWNLGAGGGKMIEAARGVVRPAGTFSYITGPVIFFSLTLAFLTGTLTLRRWSRWWLMLPTLGATLLAAAVSGSRSLLFSYLLVLGAFFLGCLLYPRAIKTLLKFFILGAVVFAVVASTQIFKDGTETTADRTERAMRSEGGVISVAYNRFFGPIVESFAIALNTEPLGRGLGLGTNAGAAMAGFQGRFLVAEDEWSRVLGESGPFLGLSYMLLRLGLVCWLFVAALKAARKGNLLPVALWGACWPMVLAGQFGQPTTLGGTVFIAGLLIAALKIELTETIFGKPGATVAQGDPVSPASAIQPVPDTRTPFNVVPRPASVPAPSVPESEAIIAQPQRPLSPFKPGRFAIHGDKRKSSDE